jgi:dihydrofolate synthase/folylpolyglutamate synthase
VCAILASILAESGKKVGLYSSPHIFKYTERIQINYKNISDKDFANYVFEISNLADKNGIDLTEFEILTAVMFKYFADNNVDVVVLETGLGGRYDATNVIKKNICSIITHIDLDHTERLGNTLDKIAYEKAGIIKPNCPCIVTEGREVFYDIADELNSMLIITNPYADTTNLALKGAYQEENLALALCAIKTVFPEISEKSIQEGLKKVQHPCRFQYIKDKNLIIDGGHNPNGIKALAESLDEYFPNTKRRFIFGCLRNKDYKTMVQTLFKSGDEVLFYHFNHKNSCSVEELQKVCLIESKELTSNTVIDFDDGHLNIICGSFYMISELVHLLGINNLQQACL